jgi:long-chain acyl-CoA synthetase
MGPQDATLVCLPMAWVYGLVTASVVTFLRGGTVVILPHFNPVRVVDAIEAERVTVFPGVTTMFMKLVRYASEAGRSADLRSLRFCVAGGEPRNEPAFEQWRALTGCAVHDVYAASECFPVVTYDPQVDPEPRRGSAGRLVEGARMRLLDAAGRDVADGDVGEAFWRAPAQMLGYFGEPELTRAVLTDDGWYRTGDHVRVDPEGYVYVVGRLSDMIIRGGSNVSPVEVESVLSEHPLVAEVAVVGLPDPEYGEVVAAAIVTTAGEHVDEDDVAAFLAPRLAPYKVPTLVREVSEIPRNASGKILRRDVAARLRAGSVPAS